MFRSIAFAAAAGLVAATLPALADVDNLAHNGSRMRFDWMGDHARIVYIEPRPGLASAGVERGTLLFEGAISKDGRLDGTAYTFKKGCAPAPYRVTGAIEGGDIRLEGAAPKRVSGSCAVARLDQTSAHSMLEFTDLDVEVAAKATGRPWSPPGPALAADASPLWAETVRRHFEAAAPWKASGQEAPTKSVVPNG